MSEAKIVLIKEKENKVTKPVFIDVELLEAVKALKQETGISIQRIVEKFVKYGIENVEVVEE